jgi:hypothetical protein
MDPFNALSTVVATRKIPPLKEASPAKVMLCVLVASTDLQKDLDVAKEVTGGVGMPSVKMVGWSALVCGQLSPVMVPPVPKVVERTWLVLFPLIRRLGRTTDWSRLHIPLQESSLQGR